MALNIATNDWIVLLYTTGRYCLKSSGVKPLSWMILQERRVKELISVLKIMWKMSKTYFICLTIVLFPDSPAPEMGQASAD